MFDLLLYIILLIGVESLEFCKNIPPYNKTLRLCNTLSDLVLTLGGFTVPSMFLLWGLEYLAISSTVIWIIMIIITYFTVKKHFVQLRGVTKFKRDTESSLKQDSNIFL